MRRVPIARLLQASLAVCSAALPFHGWAEALQVDRDYHSIQIASSPSALVLQRQFSRYEALPYLRIEQRGGLHVLRVGFWQSASMAREFAAQHHALLGQTPLVRVASYRPAMVVRGNWSDVSGVRTVDKTVAATDKKAGQTESLPEKAPEPLHGATVAPSSTSARVQLVPKEKKSAQEAGGQRLRAFDAQDYALAFDVFLGGGDRENAFLLARQAVISLPADRVWRRKLARVAEWTQRPLLAWEHWSYLFQQGERDEETLAAVWRLAPLAGAPELALAVWEWRARQDAGRVAKMTDAQWRDVFDLYEAGGSPEQGSRYFEQAYRRHGKPVLLEYAARLAENTGADERALQLFIERARIQPFSADVTLRAAIILLRRERLAEARALLLARRDEVPPEARDYWNTLANLAFEGSDADTVELALKRLDEGKAANAEDNTAAGWRRLVFLLRQQHPERAADLAMSVYRRNGDIELLMTALALYAERGQYAALTRVLAGLPEETRLRLEGDARFLLLRARHHERQGNVARAGHDLQRALTLAPDDDEVIVTMFWFLIDTHRMDELRLMLKHHASRARVTQAYWLAYAAAYHALDRYRDAIHWYRKEIARNPDDMLLLLNYADVLGRVQQGGMADRVRRHAWLKLREKYPQPEWSVPLDDKPDLLALARLALLAAPGDAALDLVHKVVGDLRGLSVAQDEGEAGKSDQQTRDWVLAWAISSEQHPNARAWLWLNAARGMAARPALWGEAQTALQLNETPHMDRLLRQHREGLPIYNRYDTAYALEHWPLALDIAFHGMEGSDVDEELHDRYRQHAPRHVSYVQVGATRQRSGLLDARDRTLELRLVMDRRWHATMAWTQGKQASADALLAAPPRERLQQVELNRLDERGDMRLAIYRRDEQAGQTGWRLSRDWAWSGHLGLTGALERHGEATESLSLRVGGSQDRLSLGFNHAIGKRQYVAATQRWSRYHTQEGDYLGRGRVLDFEAGYRLRTEFPDWRARLFVTWQDISREGEVSSATLARLAPAVRSSFATAADAVGYFLPEGSTTVGVCIGMGENLAGQNLQESYTRGWRHFYDLCPTHNSLNGAGYSGMFGIARSVSGEDHFSLRVEQANGGSGTGALSRTLAARYRLYF
jgi:predicted Zn-dependent protease